MMKSSDPQPDRRTLGDLRDWLDRVLEQGRSVSTREVRRRLRPLLQPDDSPDPSDPVGPIGELVLDMLRELNVKNTALEQEINERRQVERALRESEGRYRLLADNATDVIWTANLEGRFTYVSPSIVNLCGYTPEEMCAQPAIDTVLPDYRPKVAEAFTRARNAKPNSIDEGGIYEVEETLKGGGAVWIEVITSVIFDDEGHPAGLLGIARNIAERKKVEQMLAQRLSELETALTQIRQLHGLLPICSYCKKIRQDENYWEQLEEYISRHTDVQFSHGICPECYQKLKESEEWGPYVS